MIDPFTVLAGELQTLQKELNSATSAEAHAALLNEVRAKLKELDEMVKRRLETVYGLTSVSTKRIVDTERSFDIFERLPGGGVLWRAIVSGEDNAAAKLGELARSTRNELFACHIRSKTILRRANSTAGEQTDNVSPLGSINRNRAER